eukprot:GFYU01014727.1.p1 GENE.GFYU01014727.1~~GFYU01014727.1.p1  ORF type:complete len:553 (+),score=139.37 GFYU01014727.1:298-1956(+)
MPAPAFSMGHGVPTVKNLKGEDIQFTQLWSTRRCVVTFLRHFGCVFCKYEMHIIQHIAAELKKHDVHWVAIGMGTPERAQEFVDEYKFDCELYVDDKEDSPPTYKMFLLKQLEQMDLNDPNVRKQYDAAVAAGYSSDSKDRWGKNISQIGGTFVMGPGNTCDFAFRADALGQLPSPEDVLAAAIGQKADGKPYVFPSTDLWVKKLNQSRRADSTPGSPVTSTFPLSQAVNLQKRSWSDIGYQAAQFFAIGTVSALFPNTSIEVTVVAAVVLAGCVYYLGQVLEERKYHVTLYTPRKIDDMVTSEDLDDEDEGDDVTSIDMVTRSRSSMCHDAGGSSINPSSDIACLNKTVAWTREFLGKHHPLLGRSGPTCPFVPTSLKIDSIYLGLVHTDDNVSEMFMRKTVENCLRQFESLPPLSGAKAIYKAIIIIFPDIPISKAKVLIDGVQRKMKPEFVKRGLMLGEFHKRNNSSGLHNPDFYPLRTPFPSLALRGMALSDIVFLKPESYTLDERITFFRAFLKTFQDDMSEKAKTERAGAEKFLNGLLAEKAQAEK